MRDYECPEGTVLRLDSVNGHHRHDEFCVRVGDGLPRTTTRSSNTGVTICCVLQGTLARSATAPQYKGHTDGALRGSGVVGEEVEDRPFGGLAWSRAEYNSVIKPGWAPPSYKVTQPDDITLAVIGTKIRRAPGLLSAV